MTLKKSEGPLGTTDGRCNWCGQHVAADKVNSVLLAALECVVAKEVNDDIQTLKDSLFRAAPEIEAKVRSAIAKVKEAFDGI